MTEAPLTISSLGPVIIQVKAVTSLVFGTSRTNANDATVLLVKIPIMDVLLSLQT